MVAIAGLGIALPVQIAFVAGVLALVRRPRDASEARLVQRRASVALLAGATVAAGEVVQAVALQPLLPTWWFALALAAGSATVVALGGSAVVLRSARAVTPARAGRAGGLEADLPPPLRRYVGAIAPSAGVGAVVAMTAGSAIVEHSLAEGLIRGVLEGLAFVGCFVALGRLLGIRR